MPESSPLELTAEQFLSLRASGEDLVLIDVREPGEWDVCRLEGAELMPMGTIPAQLQKIERRADDASLLVYCHHGVRSLQVVAWLREQGIACCYSLAGGIDRWSRDIDTSIPRY